VVAADAAVNHHASDVDAGQPEFALGRDLAEVDLLIVTGVED
jgi:hypothetical protein